MNLSNANILDASIDDLSNALSSGKLTSVELVTKYLLRIAAYDTRTLCLNSIPLINKNVFIEAAASDDRRSAGQVRGPLDGIPFTVKDSYKVEGLTVASGSVAFQNLVANEDAFTVKALRDAGAVLLGKTNMCPMAYGGMLRGVYGRAESPYNLDYLAAAFGSGSSNGSGVSVAASFAAFGMGEETVSSGRSPASNNALIAYTPSRGIISIRGNWPLYPTCDVVVPHTRTIDDLCRILDVITAEDKITAGDFWRDQPFIDISPRWQGWPRGHRLKLDEQYLRGKRIAVPRMYIDQCKNGPYISSAVGSLWSQSRKDLEAAGALVEIAEEFPIITAYEQPTLALKSQPQLPADWNTVERGRLIAYAWEDFLQENNDPKISSLENVNPVYIFPQLPRENPQVKFTEPSNAVRWAELANYVRNREPSSRSGKSRIFDIPQLEQAVHMLEEMRVSYFEQWMDEHQYDYIVFPAAGDVARADADVSEESAKHAWTNGVKYSHGNRVLRHLGIPSLTVPMGLLQPSGMPMGLTFAGRAYHDVDIINAAYAYEQGTLRRTSPPLTPVLASDNIFTESEKAGRRPTLSIQSCSASSINGEDEVLITIEGRVDAHQAEGLSQSHQSDVTIFIDGTEVPERDIKLSRHTTEEKLPTPVTFTYQGASQRPRSFPIREQVAGKVARDSIMIVVVASDGQGKPSGHLELIHTSEIR